MPVNLDAVPLAVAEPRLPRPIVWMGLLIACMAAGIVLTLLFWPKNSPTGTARFWFYLAGLPVLAWMLMFGIRHFIHDIKLKSARRWNKRRHARLASEVQRGQRSLLVLGSVYESALGHADLGAKLMNEACGLVSMTTGGRTESIRCSMLPDSLRDETTSPETLEKVFAHILRRLRPRLSLLPKSIPIQVHLQVDAGVGTTDVVQAWEAVIRDDTGLGNARLIEAREGLLILDKWLDADANHSAGEIVLIVAAKLSDAPTDESGEAAVGLLMAKNLRRDDTDRMGAVEIGPEVRFHRPVSFDSGDAPARLSDALRWAGQEAGAIEASWAIGLEAKISDAAYASLDAGRVGKKDDAEPLRFDVDAAIGHTGVAAGWLAAAAALDRCLKERQPQLVAAEEAGQGRFFVVTAV